ncbi:zinc metalloprotease HtpX [Myxococcota bacterium]|nr:zinc metalloprotease HtpX [Myxococcota bacterium]
MYAIKTTLLLTFLTALLVGGAYAVTGDPGAAGIALLFAAVLNFFTYFFSDRIVLRMYRAREVSPSEAPQLHAVVDELVGRAGIPKPRVYVIPDPSPNAFATGRNPRHAAVAVTEGLVRIMSPRELRGVLAHELGHVTNRDILISTVAATVAGAVGWISSMARWGMIFGGGGRDDERGSNPLGAVAMILFAMFAGLAAALIQMAISRAREYSADLTAARLTGDPVSLADALRKLGTYSARVPLDAHQATAHMFIVNPLRPGEAFARMFSTHPPLEDRIARLETLAYGGALDRRGT